MRSARRWVLAPQGRPPAGPLYRPASGWGHSLGSRPTCRSRLPPGTRSISQAGGRADGMLGAGSKCLARPPPKGPMISQRFRGSRRHAGCAAAPRDSLRPQRCRCRAARAGRGRSVAAARPRVWMVRPSIGFGAGGQRARTALGRQHGALWIWVTLAGYRLVQIAAHCALLRYQYWHEGLNFLYLCLAAHNKGPADALRHSGLGHEHSNIVVHPGRAWRRGAPARGRPHQPRVK